MNRRATTHVWIAGVLALVSVPAFAVPPSSGDSYQQPVTVFAPEPELVTRQVPYGDLALSTAQGREILMHRVGQAVNELCPIFDEQGRLYDAQDCRDFAWSGAHAQIKRAINRAMSGSEAAMVVELTARRLK